MKEGHARAHMNPVTLVTQAHSRQKEVRREEGTGEEKGKGGRNYYHSLPSQLIKSITSNMLLMMVKVGGN